MIAADLPVLLLVAGAAVLVVSTVLTVFSLPLPRFPDARPAALLRRFRRRRSEPIVIAHRRVVTGRPPVMPIALPPVAVRPAPRPPTPRPPAIAPGGRTGPSEDGRPRDGVSRAEAEIEHLLDTDPERLARLMMQWIRDDREAGA